MKNGDWTIKSMLSWTADYFAKQGVNPARLTAELLLASVLKTERLYLYTHFDQIVGEDERTLMREFIKRRLSGEPTQHIIGYCYFWNHKISIDGRAMAPRPETEHLLEVIIGEFPEARNDALNILELGVGSGCAAIALASEFPKARITGTDKSEKAIELAAENIKAAGLEDRISLILSDLFSAVEPSEKFDIVFSNPPYIPTDEIETLSAEVKDYDPRDALDGGADGLEIIRRIVKEVAAFHKPRGFLALEIGQGQAEKVKEILAENGYEDIKTKKDLQGIQRVTYAYLASEENSENPDS